MEWGEIGVVMKKEKEERKKKKEKRRKKKEERKKEERKERRKGCVIERGRGEGRGREPRNSSCFQKKRKICFLTFV